MELPIKRFVYAPTTENTIYIANDLDTILQQSGENDLISVYAVVELENGETLFYTDRTYAGELMLHGRFMHCDSFFGFYPHRRIVYL